VASFHEQEDETSDHIKKLQKALHHGV